jgi:hypothetical protein
MGRNRVSGSVTATLPVTEVVECVTGRSEAGLEAAPQSPRGCARGRECLTCAWQMSDGENSSALALLGLAGSVTGNARSRCMWDMSVAASRTDTDADLISGRQTGGSCVPQARGCGCWR